MAALEDWLNEFDHASSFREKYGQQRFVSQTLREARHYYRTRVFHIQVRRSGESVPLGIQLGVDHAPFVDQFSTPSVEAAALAILRFFKSFADTEGLVLKPVELTTSLMTRLCGGDKRVSQMGVDGNRHRVRVTKLAIDELTKLGILTLQELSM